MEKKNKIENFSDKVIKRLPRGYIEKIQETNPEGSCHLHP